MHKSPERRRPSRDQKDVQRRTEPPLVLIVEDDLAVANLIKDLLEDEGYRTLQAQTGRQGQELAHRYRPDLIILDLYLPDKEGVEVLYELKASPDTASIPIIVVSAYTLLLAPEDMIRLAEVVSKPFDVDRLLEAVKRALKVTQVATSPDETSGS